MDIDQSKNEVRALFQSLLDRWTEGDAVAYAELFTEDADYIAFDGINLKGRLAIAQNHEPLFKKWLKGSHLLGDIESMNVLSSDVISLVASGSILEAGKKIPDPSRASRQTLIAVHREGVWKFSSFQNTRIRPITSGFISLLVWKFTDSLWNILNPSS